MTNSNQKRDALHHYIPISFLKAWANEHGTVNTYRFFENLKQFKRGTPGVKVLFSEPGLNNIDLTNGEFESDPAIQKIDNDGAIIVETLRKNHMLVNTLPEVDKRAFMDFICSLYGRNPNIMRANVTGDEAAFQRIKESKDGAEIHALLFDRNNPYGITNASQLTTPLLLKNNPLARHLEKTRKLHFIQYGMDVLALSENSALHLIDRPFGFMPISPSLLMLTIPLFMTKAESDKLSSFMKLGPQSVARKINALYARDSNVIAVHPNTKSFFTLDNANSCRKQKLTPVIDQTLYSV